MDWFCLGRAGLSMVRLFLVMVVWVGLVGLDYFFLRLFGLGC
jgi:hypothetical protein